MDLEDEEDDEWGGADDVIDDDDDDGTLPPNDGDDVPPEVPAFAELLAGMAAGGGELTEEQAFRLALALSLEGNDDGNGASAQGTQQGDETVPPVPPVPRYAWANIVGGANINQLGSANNSSLQTNPNNFAPGSFSDVASESDDLRSPEKLSLPTGLIKEVSSKSFSPQLTVLLLDGIAENLTGLSSAPAIQCIPTLKMMFSLFRNAPIEDIAVSRAVHNILQLLGLAFSTKSEASIVETKLSDYQLLVARFLASLFAVFSTQTSKQSCAIADQVYSGIKNYLPAILQTFLVCLNEHFLKRHSQTNSNAHENSAQSSENVAVPVKSVDHLKMLPMISYDLHPFVESSLSASNSNELFKDYDFALIDSVLRFLSRLKPFVDKQAVSPSSAVANSAAVVLRSDEWAATLCSLLSLKSLAPAHRQIRRVLQQILGGPEEYRNFRDMNELESTLVRLSVLLLNSGSNSSDRQVAPLPYDRLLEICEQLKHCIDVAVGRPASLARLFARRPDLLVNIFQMCATVPTDEVRLSLLQLLDTVMQQPKDASGNHIANVILAQIPSNVMSDFLLVVLLSSHTSSVRWVGHDVVLALAKSCNNAHAKQLLTNLESIFCKFSGSGNRAAQIVDLFGFALLGLKPSEKSTSELSSNDELVQSTLEFTVTALEKANFGIKQHPNAGIYSRLATAIGGLNAGYYLETAQCSSCANFQETPFSQVKLQSLKSDAKFTSTTQTFKLSGGSHQIQSIAFKFIDVKKHRMIKTINLYYNNRFSVPLVDLKGRPALWQRAKTVSLTRQQSDARIEFLVPITAGNLMFEIAEFYENKSNVGNGPGGQEVVQCPRCSNVVTGSSGVCSNCGENVFQCHKCRAIHLLYDERDPFMCASCGYSKYVKIETVVTCRPSASVEPIENDADYEKTLTTVDSLLEKIDQSYQQLNGYRSNVIALLDRLSGREELSKVGTETSGMESSESAQVNPVIQQLVTRYAHDCRHTSGELSRLAERLRACRMELLSYEARRNNTLISVPQTPKSPASLTSPSVKTTPRHSSSLSSHGLTHNLCFTCLTSTVNNCLVLLRAFALNDIGRRLLSDHVKVLVPLLLDLSATSTSNRIRSDARAILAVLTALYPDAARGLSHAISMEAVAWLAKGAPPDDVPFIRSSIQMLASSALRNDSSWETYFRTAVQLFVEGTQRPILSPFVWEALMSPILEMFHEMLKPSILESERSGSSASKIPVPLSRRQQTPQQNAQQQQQADQKAAAAASANVAEGFVVDVIAWLSSDPQVCFTKWRHAQQNAVSVVGKLSVAWQQDSSVKRALSLRNRGSARSKYLMEKYAAAWRMALIKRKMCPLLSLKFEQVGTMPLLSPWVKSALFCPYSAGVRQMITAVLEAMVLIAPVHLRRCHIIAFLTPCLEDVVRSEAVCDQFVALYKKLISQPQWRLYMTIKGGLHRIFKLIDSEIKNLTETEVLAIYSSLGGFTASGFSGGLVSVSLTRGAGLGALIDILTSLFEVDQIKRCHKKEAVSLLLRGYLALKRLVASRTRAIDRTQTAMLSLLETLTGTTEADRRELADICISIARTMPFDDYKSPTYVFERLCEIIHPEEKQKDDFLIIIEKCPEQEEFLQGRMLGNPYKSSDPGMGPLMRDIKNKICHDCELIALLEDENSMELLVRNKIINLALPAKDVYRRVWLAEAGPNANPTEPMRIIYRMRGLLGDATEDQVESLPPIDANIDKEETFKMASLMAGTSGGLSMVLERLAGVENVAAGKTLLTIAVKLLQYCVNVAVNRRKLTDPNLGAVSSLLTALTRCLRLESLETTAPTTPARPTGPPTTPRAQPPGQASSTEGGTLSQELCRLIETILAEAAQLPANEHAAFASHCASISQIEQLLQLAVTTSVKSNSAVLHSLMHILPYLALGSADCMSALIKYFKPYCAAFSRMDQERSADDLLIIDCFCTVVQNIDVGEYGSNLKDLVVQEGILGMAVEYIQLHTPSGKWAPDSPEWRELSSRPAVPYVLRILAGIVKGHPTSQKYIAENCLRQLHQTEQACSVNNIGPLAEAVLDAMIESAEAKQAVADIREATRQEKKRLAMNRRQKQLADLGMATDETTGKVRVTTTPKASLQAGTMIQEEPGLACCICREGYKSSPNRLLAIYTYTRYCPLEEFDPRGRSGVATASSMVCVHIDCHDAAVQSHARSAGGQADWTLAQLHNAGARCNGLLPTQGPNVTEQPFNHALQRYNMNVCEVASLSMSGGWSYTLVVHDVKHLLLQLAHQKPFSAEWGGGGRETNLQLVPHLLYLALYALSSHESAHARDSVVIAFLEQPSSRWVSSAYEPEGAFYYTVLSLLIVDRDQWQALRLGLLRRILIAAHARHLSPNQPIESLGAGDRQIYTFDIYRPALLFFALIDAFYTTVWPRLVPSPTWSEALANYIRNNDAALVQACGKLLAKFDSDLVPAELEEFTDLLNLHEEVPDATAFLKETIASAP